jgi:ribosomal-protein-alanine N-acetyltransferase
MLELNFDPFPELRTERLLLRRMTVNDADELFFFRSNPEVMQFIAREPTKTVEEARDFIGRIDKNIDTNVAILWAIAFNEEPSKMIGTINLWQIQKDNYRAELGYLLHPAHWKKGLMKESIRKIIEYAFNGLGLHSLEAKVDPNNRSSIILLEKTGFVKEGYFREDYFFRDKFLDTAVYSLLNKQPL